MTGSVKHSYELGFKAAKKGDLINNNPYGEVSSVKKYAWLGGYNDYLAGHKLDLSIFNKEK